MRIHGLAALVAVCGCLSTPDSPEPSADGGQMPGDDGGAPPVADSGVACPDAFAVAYTSLVSVRPSGGAFAGMLVIEALGDQVDLLSMTDDGDDSFQVELELTQPNYELVPPGAVFGELDPGSEALIIGPLIKPQAWAESATPAFQLTFSSTDVGAPLHQARALLTIGTSTAALDVQVVYDQHQPELAIPLAAARVASLCGE